jgi:hypothetical protein
MEKKRTRKNINDLLLHIVTITYQYLNRHFLTAAKLLNHDDAHLKMLIRFLCAASRRLRCTFSPSHVDGTSGKSWRNLMLKISLEYCHIIHFYSIRHQQSCQKWEKQAFVAKKIESRLQAQWMRVASNYDWCYR